MIQYWICYKEFLWSVSYLYHKFHHFHIFVGPCVTIKWMMVWGRKMFILHKANHVSHSLWYLKNKQTKYNFPSCRPDSQNSAFFPPWYRFAKIKTTAKVSAKTVIDTMKSLSEICANALYWSGIGLLCFANQQLKPTIVYKQIHWLFWVHLLVFGSFFYQ